MDNNKTITLNAQMVISRSENGVDLVQVLPDNPCVDFVRKRRIRGKAELKQPHSTLSYGRDGIDRYTFYLPSGQRNEFSKWLKKEAAVVVAYMKNKR